MQQSLPQTSSCFRSKPLARWFLCVCLIFSVVAQQPAAASRIKDVVDFEGVRNNMLIGYGLVVGLDGTGDSLRNAPFTRQSLESMLERLGVNTRGATLNTNNIAAVMVTASLPPFAAQGTNVDVAISAMGDAKSLRTEYGNVAAEMTAGTYDITVGGAVVANVPIQSGHDTRVHVGVLRLNATGNTNFEIYPPGGTKSLGTYYGQNDVGLPVGTFEVEVNGQRERVTIPSGGIAEF